MTSSLDWKEAKALSKQCLEPILWHLDLGLFDRLAHPISHEMQLKSLVLSVRYFVDFVPENSRDVCLYAGDLDFSLKYPWDEDQKKNFLHWCVENGSEPENPLMKKLYCRDAATEYLTILANELPDTITPYLLLDAGSIKDPFECLCLLDPERTERFHRAVKNSSVMTRDLIWGDELSQPPASSVGIFLPHSFDYQECDADSYREAIKALNDSKVPYRLIAEDHLIRDWDGLDILAIDSNSVSMLGMRKVNGFRAAGGRIVELDQIEETLSESVDPLTQTAIQTCR